MQIDTEFKVSRDNVAVAPTTIPSTGRMQKKPERKPKH